MSALDTFILAFGVFAAFLLAAGLLITVQGFRQANKQLPAQPEKKY